MTIILRLKINVVFGLVRVLFADYGFPTLEFLQTDLSNHFFALSHKQFSSIRLIFYGERSAMEPSYANFVRSPNR